MSEPTATIVWAHFGTEICPEDVMTVMGSYHYQLAGRLVRTTMESTFISTTIHDKQLGLIPGTGKYSGLTPLDLAATMFENAKYVNPKHTSFCSYPTGMCNEKYIASFMVLVCLFVNTEQW